MKQQYFLACCRIAPGMGVPFSSRHNPPNPPVLDGWMIHIGELFIEPCTLHSMKVSRQVFIRPVESN
jgi:hypothetical protein